MATYDGMRARASHNSYSGGVRGSLIDQLNANVRCIEFDFHDNDFETIKDYRIGHLKPGAEVDHQPPNPADDKLDSWLAIVNAWSIANPGHEPITIVLDAKDDLTDNDGADLEELNRRLEAMFGARLFTRGDYERHGAWPDVDDMRDKVLCVLSGNGGSRAAYRWSIGSTPSVSANAKGDVVVAYRSSTGEVNQWAGRIAEGDGAMTWLRKNTLAVSDIDLAEPAIQINDDGWVVAVYRFGPRPGPQKHGLMLASKLGHLTDGRINWGKVQVLGEGMTPSLKIDGNDIELIYRNADGGGRQLATGVIDRAKRQITWKKPKTTQRASFPRDAAQGGTHTIRVEPDALGAIGCAIDGGALLPIRFRQILFVERQSGEDPTIFRDAPFFGAGAANRHDLAEARKAGLVCRAWGFAELNKCDPTATDLENFPATDTPLIAWYQTYVN
ncbi:MAG TPA: hypothetical protein VMZ90_01865 [Vicinamibacterales bacterium]|nr:hypothetical protein [Vicinamibacterales bacterium]